MKSFAQFQVYIPECFGSPDKFRKMALNLRVIWDDRSKEFVFGCPNHLGVYLKEPELNPRTKIIEAYVALAAVAYHKRVIRKFPTPPKCWEPKPERKGFINGKRVANICDLYDDTVSWARLTADDIKIVLLRFMNPETDTECFWDKITSSAVVTQIEDYVILREFEVEEYKKKAEQLIEATRPIREKDGCEFYEFNLKDLDFAPNSTWKVYAISNVRNNDGNWNRNTYDVDHVSGQLKISWENLTYKRNCRYIGTLNPFNSLYGKKGRRGTLE